MPMQPYDHSHILPQASPAPAQAQRPQGPSINAAHTDDAYEEKITPEERKKRAEEIDFYQALFAAFGTATLLNDTEEKEHVIHFIAKIGSQHLKAQTTTGGTIFTPKYESDGLIVASHRGVNFQYNNNTGNKFSINDARSMVLIAFANEDFIKNGIQLSGTPEERALLELAVDELNNVIPGGIKLGVKNRLTPPSPAAAPQPQNARAPESAPVATPSLVIPQMPAMREEYNPAFHGIMNPALFDSLFAPKPAEQPVAESKGAFRRAAENTSHAARTGLTALQNTVALGLSFLIPQKPAYDASHLGAAIDAPAAPAA